MFWVAVLWTASAGASPASDAHLLEGARKFKAGAFAEALVEFKVAQRLGAGGEASWYSAATLVKLDRPEEALEAFAEAARQAPEASDGVLSYYRALACYQAKLFLCASRLLESAERQIRGRIAEQARALREEIAGTLGGVPPASAVDHYWNQANAALAAQRFYLARIYLEEVIGLSLRRNDPSRESEARAALKRLPDAPRVQGGDR